MALMIKLENVLCLLVHLALSCSSFRTKTFSIEKNQKILNNHLKTFYGIESLISCGRKCTENVQCAGTSFEESTLICKLHSDSDSNPMLTTYSDGTSSLIYNTDDATTTSLREERIPVDMRFDVDTLHSEMYVSPDKTVFSNTPSSDVTAWPPGNNQLVNYEGVVSTYCVDPGQILEYNVAVIIVNPLEPAYIAAELCLCDKTAIDKSSDCELNGWVFFKTLIMGDFTRVSISAMRHSTIRYDLSEDIARLHGTHQKYTFSLIVDRINNTFSLFDKETHTLFYSFTDIKFDGSLCPAFKVYGIGASITILSAYQINKK